MEPSPFCACHFMTDLNRLLLSFGGAVVCFFEPFLHICISYVRVFEDGSNIQSIKHNIVKRMNGSNQRPYIALQMLNFIKAKHTFEMYTNSI